MNDLRYIKDSPLWGAEFCQYHPQFYAGFEGPIHKMDSSHHLSAVKDGERMRLGEFQHAEWAGYLQVCANIVPVLADRIEALEAALRNMIDGYEEYDLIGGKPVLRPIGAQSSWIQRATATLTAPPRLEPSPDPQSAGETAPR
jgi:hypothetical protein